MRRFSAEGLGSIAFASSPIPILLARAADGRLLRANRACLATLEITEAEIDAGYLADALALDPLDRAAIRDQLFAEGTVPEFELTRRRAGTSDQRLLATFATVDVDGELCVVASFIDVTQRRQLRRELQIAQQQLQTFLDIAPAAISLKGVDGRILWANQRAVDDLDASHDDLRDATSSHLFPTEPARRIAEIEAQVLRDGELVRAEISLPLPAGVRHYELTKFPLRNAEGEPYAIGTIGSDITERHNAIAALRESEARFRQVTETMEEAFVLWSVEPDAILYASPSIEPMLGVPPSLDDPSAVLAVVHPDDRAHVREALLTAIRERRPAVVDFRVMRPGGDVRWIRSRTRLVDTPDLRPRRLSSLLADITEQRVADAAARTARAEAEAANRAKSEFLSRMSHELRTPLNAVLGFAQLLQSQLDDEGQIGYVDQILKAGSHLLGLVDEVLDISRIESGFLRLSLEPVAMADVIAEAIGLIAPAAEAAGIMVACAGLPDVHVRADRLRLKQVLLNLLSNAVKYNRPGGRVEIDCNVSSASHLTVVVADDGRGIAPEAMARLFEPFDRLGAEDSPVEGTGLGLALARQLMDLMGGSIDAESTAGRGSRFWIELELAAPSSTAVAPRLASRTAPPVTGSAGGAALILLIEDNLSNVKLVEEIVRSRPQLRLLTAMTGREGLERVRQEPVDVVLLDMHLPDISGLAVLAALRSSPETEHLAVVVVSADATDAQIEATAPLGVADYLTKPLDVARFLEVIDALTSATAVDRMPVVVYIDDDDFNRHLVERTFERKLPGIDLRVAEDAAGGFALIAEADLLLVDRNLPDGSGLEFLAAVLADPARANLPAIVLSGDPPPPDWVDTPSLRYLTKPYRIEALAEHVLTLLGLPQPS